MGRSEAFAIVTTAALRIAPQLAKTLFLFLRAQELDHRPGLFRREQRRCMAAIGKRADRRQRVEALHAIGEVGRQQVGFFAAHDQDRHADRGLRNARK